MTPPAATLTDVFLRWTDRRRYWLLGLVLAFYFVAFNGQWRPGNDSAEHITIARCLLTGQGYTHPTGWHEGLQPGLAQLVAAASYPFGEVHFPAALAVMLAISLATLALAFVLLRRTFNRPTAVLLTLLLALTETHMRLSYELLTDMPFCFGFMLLLLGWSYLMSDAAARRTQMGGLVCLGIGTLVMAIFRSVVLTVIAGVLATVIVRCLQRRRVISHLFAGGVCVAAWGTAKWLDPRFWQNAILGSDEGRVVERLFEQTTTTLTRLFTENLPALATENAAEALLGADFGGVLSFLLAIIILAAWLRLVRINLLWAMVVAAFMAQWLLFMPGDRYFLPVLLPLLVGWWELVKWVQQRRLGQNGRWATIIAGVMLGLWVLPNVVKDIDLLITQRRRPFLVHYENGRYDKLQKLADVIAEKTGPNDLIVSAQGQVLTWYSQRKVMDPKRMRVIAGYDKTKIYAELQRHERCFVVKPDDRSQRRLMKKLPVTLGDPIATLPRGEGREDWTLHPAELRLPPTPQSKTTD